MALEAVAVHTRTWSVAGENELLKIVRTEALKTFRDGKQNDSSQSSSSPSLHELIYDIFDELTNATVAKGFWKKLLAISGEPTLLAQISSKLNSVVLDVLVVQEMEAAEVGNAERHKFLTELVKAGLKDYLVKNVDIVWRFSISSAAAILGITEANLSRVHRVATSKHFFTLPKHNLMREESEGYSKLITYLLTADFSLQPHLFTSNITQMIGAYALHPSRVLDLVISCIGYHLDRFFENSFQSRSYADYERAVEPIRIYLNAQDTTHIYTLLGFHLRSHPWQKDATSALPKPAGSANDATEPIEPVENLPLSTARILAMLVRFGYFKLHHIWSLLQIPSGSPYPDLPLKGSEAATSNADESLTADEMFALSPKLQMLTALLEVPDDAPLAFIRDQSDLNELFLETLQPFIFQVKRVANVFSSRVVSHLNPLFTALMPAQALLASPKSSNDGPTLQTLIDVLFDLKDLLHLLGENISSPLHHLLCLLGNDMLDGILRSGGVLSELDAEVSGKGSRTPLKSSRSIPSENVSLDAMSSAFSMLEELITKVILPAFVCLEINGDTMWRMLQKFPFEWRYRLYFSWGKMMRHASFPGLTAVGTESSLKVRGMMKRMTDVSIKETGRPLCKFSNKFPPVLSGLVSSLVFPNFVQPLAESMRYLSDLSLDVLIYSCLDAALNMPASASAHFSNVASFVASVCKLYYERLDIVPLLDVIEQLIKRSKLTGATLFTTLLSKMGCVDILEETLSAQIRMVNSFPSLHTLGISGALQVKETSRSSIIPLRDRLWSSNSWLPLYILIQQLENTVVFYTETNDLSAISHSYDTVHQLSLQLAEFVAHIFKQYATQVNPSLLLSAGQIAQTYNIPFQSILHFYRPILHLIYNDVAQLIGTTNPLLVTLPTNSEEDTNDKSLAEPKGTKRTKAKKTAANRAELTNSQQRSLSLVQDIEFTRKAAGRTNVLMPIAEELQQILDSYLPPPDPNADYYINKTDFAPVKDLFPMTNHFLTVFWGLKLIDVECNEALYRTSIAQQTQAQSGSHPSNAKRDKAHDISPAMLEKDLNSHKDHVNSVFDRLKQHSIANEWFDASMGYRLMDHSSSSAMDVDGKVPNPQILTFFESMGDACKKKCVAMSILQHCIIPRAMISADDALYCGAFIKMLHKLNPSPLWDTEVFMDVFLSISPLMFSSTSTNESYRYGRLVCSVLETIFSWRDFDTWCSDLGGRDYSNFAIDTASPVSDAKVASEGSNGPTIEMDVDKPPMTPKSSNGVDEEDLNEVAATKMDEDDSEGAKKSNETSNSNPESQTASTVDTSSTSLPKSESDGNDSGKKATKAETAEIPPIRLAHRAYCLKSIQWEKTLLDHVMEGITKPVDRWMRRAILFSLKEMNLVFPSSERFCIILSRCIKTNASGNEDLKALVNSYQNLLEAKAKSVLPHAQFALLFPGFEFPEAPAPTVTQNSERNLDTTTQSNVSSSDAKGTPSIYLTSGSERRDHHRDHKEEQADRRSRTSHAAAFASTSSPASTSEPTTSSARLSNATNQDARPAESGRTPRGRGFTTRSLPAPAAPAPPPPSTTTTPAPPSTNNKTQTASTSAASKTISTTSSAAPASAASAPSSTSTQTSGTTPTANTATSSTATSGQHTREHNFERGSGRDSRSGPDRDNRDNRGMRDGRDAREAREGRDERDNRDRDFARDHREGPSNSGGRDFRDREFSTRDKDARDGRDTGGRDFGARGPNAGSERNDRDRFEHGGRDGRDSRDRDAGRDNRGSGNGSDFRDGPRELRDNREVRDARDGRDGRDFRHQGDRDGRGRRDAHDSRASQAAPSQGPQHAGDSDSGRNVGQPQNPKKRSRDGESDLPAPENEKRSKTNESQTPAKASSSRNPAPAPTTQPPPEKEVSIGPPLPPSSSRGGNYNRRRKY